MPKFYFHYRDAHGLHPDDAGQQFSEISSARIEAEESAREIAADKIRSGERLDDSQMEVCDDRGTLLAIVRLRDMVKI